MTKTPLSRQRVSWSLAAFVLVLVLLVGAGAKASHAASRTHESDSPRVRNHFLPNTASFWGRQRGLVGTGAIYGAQRGGTIERTTDGGRSFETVLQTDLAVAWIDTAGSRSAWVKLQGPGYEDRVLHTADGGDHWDWLPSAAAFSPSFSDHSHGVALASRDQSYGGSVLEYTRLAQTSDGGQSWSRLASPCDRYAEGALPVAGSNRATWVVCVGDQETGTESKEVFKSTDDGQNWKSEARSSSRGGPGTVGYVSEMRFDDSDDGALLIDSGLWLSSNHAKRWTEITGNHRSYRDFVTAQPLSSNLIEGIRYGRHDEQLVFSNDGGKHWGIRHRWPVSLQSRP